MWWPFVVFGAVCVGLLAVAQTAEVQRLVQMAEPVPTGEKAELADEVLRNEQYLRKYFNQEDLELLTKFHAKKLASATTTVLRQGRLTILVNNEDVDGDQGRQREGILLDIGASAEHHVAFQSILHDHNSELAAVREILGEMPYETKNLHLHGLDNIVIRGFSQLLLAYLSGPTNFLDPWGDQKEDIVELLKTSAYVSNYWSKLVTSKHEVWADFDELVYGLLDLQFDLKKELKDIGGYSDSEQWFKLMKKLLYLMIDEIKVTETVDLVSVQEWIESLAIDNPSLALNLWVKAFDYFDITFYQTLLSTTIVEILRKIEPEPLIAVLGPVQGSYICQTLSNRYPDTFTHNWEVVLLEIFECDVLGMQASCKDHEPIRLQWEV
ncbi:hypothetical protein Pelo_2074 [Pelomyxa schiedti]|nr:hypothetical protein Pelo_2074 [Pelomyxa schiedti]